MACLEEGRRAFDPLQWRSVSGAAWLNSARLKWQDLNRCCQKCRREKTHKKLSSFRKMTTIVSWLDWVNSYKRMWADYLLLRSQNRLCSTFWLKWLWLLELNIQIVHQMYNLVQLTELRQSWATQLASLETKWANFTWPHTAEWSPTQPSSQHMLSKHFQSSVFPSDCSRALTLICQYLQIPLQCPIHPLSPCQNWKGRISEGSSFLAHFRSSLHFKCLPHSRESRAWPLPTPTVCCWDCSAARAKVAAPSSEWS